MIRRKYFLPLLFGSLVGSAQDLNTQITVKHEVVPEERAASRIRLFPTISLPIVSPGRLPAASLLEPAKLSPFIITLEPATFAASQTPYPWRGYAVVSYGPLYNLNASLGYRLADSEKVKTNAYLQFNGVRYQSDHPDVSYRTYGPVTLHNNSLAAGIDNAWTPMAGGLFSANALYRFSKYNFPLPELNNGKPYANPEDCFVNDNDITTHLFDVNLGWKHNPVEKFAYNISAGYGLHKFGDYPGALMENEAKASATFTYDHGAVSHWSLNADFNLLATDGNRNKGAVTILPTYRLILSHFQARIGVKFAIETGNSHHSTETRWLPYPDVFLLWHPSSAFNLYLNANGRTDLNSMASLYEAQPYFFPTVDNYFGTSHVYNFEAGTTIGPFKGASLTLFAGYDIADNWLTPAFQAGKYSQRDVTGAHFGAKAAYKFRNYLDISAKAVYATAPDDDFDRAYYLWRDHARWDFTFNTTVRPIEPLAIGIGFHLRTNRSKPIAGGHQDLGNIYDLNASIAYRITPAWSVFINGENLINHHYYLGPAIPAQGIRGMVGASCKF